MRRTTRMCMRKTRTTRLRWRKSWSRPRRRWSSLRWRRTVGSEDEEQQGFSYSQKMWRDNSYGVLRFIVVCVVYVVPATSSSLPEPFPIHRTLCNNIKAGVLCSCFYLWLIVATLSSQCKECE
uniref:(northern house mosquito) hypothetical protein n=1 Tax=Culex pipiens TaxID=7175 RepID=A0A8D8AK55_CULPI